MQSILGNSRKADITFRANGRIDISAGVAKHLQLCRGDAIDVLVDRGEFYLYVKSRSVRGRHNARVFPTNKRGNHFRSSSCKLCLAILKECGVTKRADLCVGEPVESHYGTLIPIITKHVLQYD
ncbi:MAG: hypothetical protein SNH27_12530 [Rikenellaceae bacterium]